MNSHILPLTNDWYEKSGKHPKLTDGGFWRWILPDPPNKLDTTTSELPSEIFNRLKSTQKFPWLFKSRIEAVIMAKISAQMAVLSGWIPS